MFRSVAAKTKSTGGVEPNKFIGSEQTRQLSDRAASRCGTVQSEGISFKQRLG